MPLLSPRTNPSVRSSLCLAALLGLLLAAGFQWLLRETDGALRLQQRYGELLADQLAVLGQDALLREDNISLNVMAEKVAAEPAIAAVTILALDGTVLAAYGNPNQAASRRSTEFTRSIKLADTAAAIVKVTVAPTAMDTVSVAASLTSTLLPWLLAALASWGAIVWYTRPSKAEGSSYLFSNSGNVSASGAAIATENMHLIMLVVHLFNGKEMQASRRNALLNASLKQIEAVAQLYHASHQSLTDTSIGILFDGPDIQDQEFQAACAALVLARLCDQPGGGRYRYSLQRVELTATAPPYELDPVQADALLHAELADDNTIALSAAYARQLSRPERLDLTREHSPALGSLHLSEASDYFLLSGANPATERMLAQQAAILSS